MRGAIRKVTLMRVETHLRRKSSSYLISEGPRSHPQLGPWDRCLGGFQVAGPLQPPANKGSTQACSFHSHPSALPKRTIISSKPSISSDDSELVFKLPIYTCIRSP
jgi:hypothetical protein